MITYNAYKQEIKRLQMEFILQQPENISGLHICKAPSLQNANPGLFASNSPVLNVNFSL